MIGDGWMQPALCGRAGWVFAYIGYIHWTDQQRRLMGNSSTHPDLLIRLNLLEVPLVPPHKLVEREPIGLHLPLVGVELEVGRSVSIRSLARIARKEGLDVCRER
jgi:hypothetical protein